MKTGLKSVLCRCVIALLLFGIGGAASAAETEYRPYDEKADARAAIAAALADNPGKLPILLTFGANWCSDSRALEGHYRSAELSPMLAAHFKLVHIDVGVFHRNLDLVKEYGNPIETGIPAVVLLQPDGKRIYVSNHGELSSAGSMGRAKALAFFEALAKRPGN